MMEKDRQFFSKLAINDGREPPGRHLAGWSGVYWGTQKKEAPVDMKHGQICLLVAFAASISPCGTPFPDEAAGRTVARSGVRSSRAARTFDWPRWRGPNADSVADGGNLPVQWSQTENVRWSVKLPGWGTSSPVVYGDRLFVTSQVDQDGKKSLLTLCFQNWILSASSSHGMDEPSVWTRPRV